MVGVHTLEAEPPFAAGFSTLCLLDVIHLGHMDVTMLRARIDRDFDLDRQAVRAEHRTRRYASSERWPDTGRVRQNRFNRLAIGCDGGEHRNFLAR
jgi:hypothetical protein